MSTRNERGRGFFAELRRRHVVRTTLAYAAMVFVVLQLGEIIFPAFQTNAQADHLIRLLVVGAVLLFPVVVVMAWVYEITPMGIRSMAEVDNEAGIEPHGSLSHRAALMGITLAAVAGAAVWWQQTEEWIPETRGLRAASIFEGAATTDAEGPIASLAVLPLEDLSAEPGQEYFAPGMHEALLSELGQVDFLRVISRTSVLQYDPAGRSVSQIGRDLKVDAVVEGSVLRADGRVRITVQLIHAASDTHLWSRSYERELANIIDLQREVAEAVTGEISGLLRERSASTSPGRMAGLDPGTEDTAAEIPGSAGPAATGPVDAASPSRDAAMGDRTADLLPSDQGAEARPTPANPPEVPADLGDRKVLHISGAGIPAELQEAFIRGRVALFQSPDGSGEPAEEFFRTVLKGDSSFVPALAGLAGALLSDAGEGGRVDMARIEAARDAASRAVELAPGNLEAQEVLRSTEEVMQALEGGPVEVHVTAPATQLGQLTQERVARIEVREAPSDPRSGVRSFVRLVATGRLEDAENLGNELLDKGADNLELWEGMEQLNRLQADPEGLVEVRARRQEVRGREPGGSIRELVERMERDGARGYWSWKVDESRARADAGLTVYRTPLATAQLALGSRSVALGTLREAVEAGEPALATLRGDPVWDVIRADAEYQSILRTLRSRGSRGPGGDGSG